jgi:hypothetical protein
MIMNSPFRIVDSLTDRRPHRVTKCAFGDLNNNTFHALMLEGVV